MTRLSQAHAANTLRVSILGSFRLERDGRTIRLPTRKVESLFAYLVLFSEPHPREKLAALFWGDSTDELARRRIAGQPSECSRWNYA